MTGLTIGLDASNLRGGGGVTHVTQLLSNASPRDHGIERIVVWGNSELLTRLPDTEWLDRVPVAALRRNIVSRSYWQTVRLPKALREHGCDGLFAPGSYVSPRCSVPAVVMQQNQLVFEPAEAARYHALSYTRFRLAILRRVQIESIQRSRGLICLTRYARDVILPQMSRQPRNVAVVPHGIEDRFFVEPRTARPLSDISDKNPFQLVYVSIVDVYKHQWTVAEAVGKLRRSNIPVQLTFVGPAYRPAHRRLEGIMRRIDPTGEFLHYTGPVPFDRVHEAYMDADAFVFASSCETFSIILREAMAAGLPIACSNRGPMPEVLADAGVYFNPESADDIARAIGQLIKNADQRDLLANRAYQRARRYSWRTCADDTLRFVGECVGGGV